VTAAVIYTRAEESSIKVPRAEEMRCHQAASAIGESSIKVVTKDMERKESVQEIFKQNYNA